MYARILTLPLTVASAPLYAGQGVQISEPSNAALMAVGLTGLILGRYAARNKRGRGENTRKD